MVWRHPTFGHLCGYVAIPKGHKLWGQGYDEVQGQLEVGVHGDLTYADEDKETGEWVLGFDCSHAGDLSPSLLKNLMKYAELDGESMDFKLRTETYRTFEWVKAEVCSLARQLKLLDLKRGVLK